MSVDDTTLDALIKELDGLNAELRLPVGNATDEELRDLGMKILARFNDGWPTIKAELSRLSTENANLVASAATAAELARSRADELIAIQAELASAQQSNENWMNRCLAAESRAAAMREALEAYIADYEDPLQTCHNGFTVEKALRALQEG